MTDNSARRVLDVIGVLRRRSDLDLLIFFARHPRTLLTSEQIASFVGYELSEIAASLELLLEGGLLTRTQNPAHAARLYVFAADSTSGGWLSALLELASTREGRLTLLQELSRLAESYVDPRGRSNPGTKLSSKPRPFIVHRESDTKAG